MAPNALHDGQESHITFVHWKRNAGQAETNTGRVIKMAESVIYTPSSLKRWKAEKARTWKYFRFTSVENSLEVTFECHNFISTKPLVVGYRRTALSEHRMSTLYICYLIKLCSSYKRCLFSHLFHYNTSIQVITTRWHNYLNCLQIRVSFGRVAERHFWTTVTARPHRQLFLHFWTTPESHFSELRWKQTKKKAFVVNMLHCCLGCHFWHVRNVIIHNSFQTHRKPWHCGPNCDPFATEQRCTPLRVRETIFGGAQSAILPCSYFHF